MMMWSGDWSGWGWIPMLLSMLIFWGGLVAIVAFAIQALSKSQSPAPESPMDLLKERYARGEIDRDEFDERQQVLTRAERGRLAS